MVQRSLHVVTKVYYRSISCCATVSHHMHRFNMVKDHLSFSLAAAQSLVLQDLEGYCRLQRLNNNE
jgi:hypothetical protein